MCVRGCVRRSKLARSVQQQGDAGGRGQLGGAAFFAAGVRAGAYAQLGYLYPPRRTGVAPHPDAAGGVCKAPSGTRATPVFPPTGWLATRVRDQAGTVCLPRGRAHLQLQDPVGRHPPLRPGGRRKVGHRERRAAFHQGAGGPAGAEAQAGCVDACSGTGWRGGHSQSRLCPTWAIAHEHAPAPRAGSPAVYALKSGGQRDGFKQEPNDTNTPQRPGWPSFADGSQPSRCHSSNTDAKVSPAGKSRGRVVRAACARTGGLGFTGKQMNRRETRYPAT